MSTFIRSLAKAAAAGDSGTAQGWGAQAANWLGTTGRDWAQKAAPYAIPAAAGLGAYGLTRGVMGDDEEDDSSTSLMKTLGGLAAGGGAAYLAHRYATPYAQQALRRPDQPPTTAGAMTGGTLAQGTPFAPGAAMAGSRVPFGAMANVTANTFGPAARNVGRGLGNAYNAFFGGRAGGQ